MASFKQLFSAAPVNSIEYVCALRGDETNPRAPSQLFTRNRIMFYTFIAFAPGTVTGLYLHSVKLEMEQDNETMKMLAMAKARAEVEEEERKEAAVRSQMETVQSNLETLQARLRSLEEAVMGQSTAPPLLDIVVPTDPLFDEGGGSVDARDPDDILGMLEAKVQHWWNDNGMQDQVDEWWKYLWEDDDDLLNVDAWKAAIESWWTGKPKPTTFHAHALLEVVETWATVDASLSWLHNRDLIRAKIEDMQEEAKTARRAAEVKEEAARQADEARRERKVKARLERAEGQGSAIQQRIENTTQ
ncbi:Aste57867_11315 [Aphanomyces stellatus]|uniref:Aste57867_11315 protein n=1 Tax=Aphanomyces stellatus TaxID=120398 RepID=A0A485KUH4_9STRA|nr:hypothetical protein As57867_011273 [Aphanomyces stellatus]VFT88177.1 Aste57867_11315 [Aphanomyces stellatus]